MHNRHRNFTWCHSVHSKWIEIKLHSVSKEKGKAVKLGVHPGLRVNGGEGVLVLGAGIRESLFRWEMVWGIQVSMSSGTD